MFIMVPILMLSTVLGLCFTKDSWAQKDFDHYLRKSKLRLLFVLKINSNAHSSKINCSNTIQHVNIILTIRIIKVIVPHTNKSLTL